jgi:hypothetical protein
MENYKMTQPPTKEEYFKTLKLLDQQANDKREAFIWKQRFKYLPDTDERVKRLDALMEKIDENIRLATFFISKVRQDNPLETLEWDKQQSK